MGPSAIVSRFAGNRRGATAPLFAISTLVVMGAVGLSIDGARVYSIQRRMQSSLDAAVLAAGRRAVNDGNSANVDETFAQFLAAAPALADIPLRPVTPDMSQTRRISAELIADVPTVIMPILGFSTLEVRAFSSAEFGFTKLEIAMALDTTGSMGGAKLDALKDSARRMVDSLLDRAPEDGDVKISLVPFGQYVNVGIENRRQSWIDVRDDYTEPVQSCGDVRPEISRSNCRMVTYSYTMDGRPMTASYEQCDIVYGDPVYQCSNWSNSYTWRGCVGSRAYPLNLKDEDYATRIPGILNADCPSRVQPLTSSRSGLHGAIDGMVAVGETYLPSGVVWGWRSLTPGQPYAESAGHRQTANGESIRKVLILMTDGENTKSPNYPGHDGSDAALANSLTAEACGNVKSASVDIYTIAFAITSNPIKDLMRGCASGAGNFYDAADPAQLDAAMQAISQQLAGLRLTN